MCLGGGGGYHVFLSRCHVVPAVLLSSLEGIEEFDDGLGFSWTGPILNQRTLSLWITDQFG